MSSSVQRRLGTPDAVVLGLAAMLGTGAFAVWGPAAAAAGPLLLVAVVLAGVVALGNAASTADLATAHPEGGGYVWGRERLSVGAGRLAGVAYLLGRSASAAAAAGVFGAYVLPSAALGVSILAIVVAAVLNTAGVRWTPRSAYALVGGILAVLLVVVLIGLSGSGNDAAAVAAATPTAPVMVTGGVLGVLGAAGFVFFAFAGYARIATLGPEVRDPQRTVRLALMIALGSALVIYLLIAAALLTGTGAQHLAGEVTPLATLVDSGRAPGLGVLVRVGAAVAAGSALLSVLVGVSQTTVSMARRGELPRVLARGTPWRADLAGCVVAIVLTVLAGPGAAIAVSACSVLVYYAVVNLAALRLTVRRSPRWVSVVGLVGCLVLAAFLPLPEVIITVAALVVGWTACTVLPRRG